MKITYLIKRAVCAVTCCGIMLSAPVWSADQTVSAEDSPYGIVLGAETVELNISNIPNDRKVDLKLSIENNPGFSEMYILIEKSPAISFYYPASPVSASGKYSGIKNELFDTNKDVTYLTVPSYQSNTENGTFATVHVKLPDTVNPGDFFEIKYLDYFQIPEHEQSREAGILKGRKLTGKNSFSQMGSGGIKIVETPVTEPPHNDPQPDIPPSIDNNTPSEDHQQPNDQQDQNNEQQSEQTQAPQPETQETQTGISEASSVPAISSVSEKPIASAGMTTKKTTQEVTSSETTVTDDNNGVMASSDSVKMKPDRTVEIILIVAIVIVSVLGVFTFIGLFKYYRKKDQK